MQLIKNNIWLTNLYFVVTNCVYFVKEDIRLSYLDPCLSLMGHDSVDNIEL